VRALFSWTSDGLDDSSVERASERCYGRVSDVMDERWADRATVWTSDVLDERAMVPDAGRSIDWPDEQLMAWTCAR
jgi:hypothetical protein